MQGVFKMAYNGTSTATVAASDKIAAVSQCKIQFICHFTQILEIVEIKD